MDGFVHLHVHSEYSLLDGANRMTSLVARAAELGMDSLAVTDHGNLFGAVEFYAACRAGGVRPILGMEAYISPTTRTDRSMGNPHTASYHLLLLATNQTGWRNLIKLSSRAYVEGFYYKPRVDRQLLAEFQEGLVCTTACLGGEVPAALLARQEDRAEKIAREYLEIFGADRFFIEVQKQGLADQDAINPHLVTLAGRLGVGLVGTNDVHFLRAGDKPSHEVLTCISTGKTLAEGGLEYSPELYLKDPAAMREALADFPGAADNTLRIAEMCGVEMDFSARHLPRFPTPDGEDVDEHLRTLAFRKLRDRCKGEPPQEYRKRMDRELEVIRDKGFSSYFLIVHDFVDFAHRRSIPANARGSGCATLLGYALGISDVDPIRYGLLFERFTDPQREEDPDIDIDICQDGRAKVIQYVRQKYGHVAQIITYNTLKAKAAFRDVARVFEMTPADADQIAKKIPDTLGITLSEALEAEPALKDRCRREPVVQEIFDHAMRLEGLSRNAGVHAAGVVIADEPLENLLPLYRPSDGADDITQWDGPTCEKMGLLKMDFLGLRTLSTLQRARELVVRAGGPDMDPGEVPLDDDRVFELFRDGRTEGIFQFESGGMQNLLRKMRPDRIEDLIAANAMYRPGPMELIPTYCSRKSGAEPVPSVHPLVDDILAETYGIMVYQEQVMQVLNRLGKLPLNTALTLIKAISKKREDKIAAERPNFLAGAGDNGIGAADAEKLFQLILRFAGYGFNKAHSTRYAIVAYQTAWFKVHYPRQFMAALLTYESSDTDKVVEYMAEAQRMGIRMGPPDINASGSDFTVDGESIRFGLAAVKGVGVKAVESIIAAREVCRRFESLYHFCENVDLRSVNRATVEALIKCGAFDALGAHRAAMLAALDHAIELGNAAAEDRRSGQMSFFDAFGQSQPERAAPRFPEVEPLSEAQLLAAEKETLGFYVTSHPLVRFGRELDALSTVKCAELATAAEGPAVLGCMISSVRVRVTKSGRSAGKKMAIVGVEDLTGSCECICFAEAYEKIADKLTEDAMVFLIGSVDRRRDTPQIIIDDVIDAAGAVEQLTGSIKLTLAGPPDPERLEELAGVLRRHRGRCPILFEITPATRGDLVAFVRPDAQWAVKCTRDLYDQLSACLTEANVHLVGKRLRPANGNGRGSYASRGRQKSFTGIG